MKKFRATPLEELPLDWQPHIKSMARVLNQIRSFSKATPEQQERKFNKLYWDVGAIFIAMGVCTNKLPEWTLGHREINSLVSKMDAACADLFTAIVIPRHELEVIDDEEEFTNRLYLALSNYDKLDGWIALVKSALADLKYSLPRLYAAHGFFGYTVEFLKSVGPLDLYVEAVPGLVPDNMDDLVDYYLEAARIIIRRMKRAGIPEWAYAGPVFFRVGMPPLTHSGLFKRLENKLNVVMPAGPTLPIEESIFTFTFIHELGHRIYFRSLSPKARQKWTTFFEGFGDRLVIEEINYILAHIENDSYFDQHFDRKSFDKTEAAVLRQAVDAAAENMSIRNEDLSSQDKLDRRMLVHHVTRYFKRGVPSSVGHNELDIRRGLRRLRLHEEWPTDYSLVSAEEAFADSFACEIGISRDMGRIAIPPPMAGEEFLLLSIFGRGPCTNGPAVSETLWDMLNSIPIIKRRA